VALFISALSKKRFIISGYLSMECQFDLFLGVRGDRYGIEYGIKNFEFVKN